MNKPVVASSSITAPKGGWRRHLQSVFLGGLAALIPLFVTIWVLDFLYRVITGFSHPLAQWIVVHVPLHVKIEGSTATAAAVVSSILALLISIATIYAIGVLSTLVIGRKLLALVDHFIENLPLLKGIYGTTKQVITVFRQGGGGSGFKRVVLVEFPRREMWTLAFVTNELTDTVRHESYLTLFIPMTPNPTAGFFQMVPVGSVRETTWTVDQGIKIILSGGLLAPREFDFGKEPDSGPESCPGNLGDQAGRKA